MNRLLISLARKAHLFVAVLKLSTGELVVSDVADTLRCETEAVSWRIERVARNISNFLVDVMRRSGIRVRLECTWRWVVDV